MKTCIVTVMFWYLASAMPLLPDELR